MNEQDLARAILRSALVSEDECERMGYDAGKNGATTENCHCSLFSTREHTTAWERGYARGKRETP